MKLCEIYFRKDRAYVVSQSSTTFGVFVSVGPMYKVVETTPMRIGTAVLNALNASREGIPQPEEQRTIQNNLLSFTEAKNWKDLARTSTYVSVQAEGNIVTVHPHRLDPSEGFVPHGESIACSEITADVIGNAILKAANVDEQTSHG